MKALQQFPLHPHRGPHRQLRASAYWNFFLTFLAGKVTKQLCYVEAKQRPDIFLWLEIGWLAKKMEGLCFAFTKRFCFVRRSKVEVSFRKKRRC